MVKRVMMVAYHFPPMNVSSGIQRTLRFAQYLPQFGWEPTVLTAHARSYSRISEASLEEVPEGLRVRRAFALDTARHFALGGRYPQCLAIPDRWWSWCLGAVPAGLALIRASRPDVMWTTYPVATAHLIGYVLHRLTGIPWVADFRDPMAQEDYPPHPLEHRSYEWIERRVLARCTRAVFTTPGALRLYTERYPLLRPSRLALIENGYDENVFCSAQSDAMDAKTGAAPLVLLHSGSVYPTERDPRPFFSALARLQAEGDIAQGELRIVLRATGCDQHLQGLIARYRLEDLVSLRPAVPYRAALAEMLAADALLLFQSARCNNQVPGKLYEYLRARRPVLALTDPRGDTAAVLRAAGMDTIAPLESAPAIAGLLKRFLPLLRQRRAPVATDEAVAAASRESRTRELAKVLDDAGRR